jgi:hypothetical protein
MQIETYEIEEVQGELGVMAADSEALELCEKLGLAGQLELSNKETDTRFPYPKLTAVQQTVFKALFPEETALERFSSGIIPLRVLQVAAFCKEQPLIKKIVVWHPQDVKKDPVLLGRTAEYGGDYFLLARWGEALLPFEKLQEMALPIIKANMEEKAAEIRASLETFERRIDTLAKTAVLTGKLSIPTYYWH